MFDFPTPASLPDGYKLHITYYFNYIEPEFHENIIYCLDGIIPDEDTIKDELIKSKHERLLVKNPNIKDIMIIKGFKKEQLSYK